MMLRGFGAGGGAWLPEWQLLPGVRVVVDKFGGATRGVPATAWFLTHFHADHYGGLTRKWCSQNKVSPAPPPAPPPACPMTAPEEGRPCS